MFLVRIVSGLAGIILHIDTARLLGGAEIAGADAGGDHDLRGSGRILHGVAANLRGQVEGTELVARRRHFLEPPDSELVLTRQCVDRDDGSLFSSRDAAARKGVDITVGVVIVAAGDVTSDRVTGGWLDALADRDGGGEVEHAVGIGVVDRGDRWCGGERTIAIRIRKGWTAEQALRLDVNRHIPRHAAGGKFEQGAAGLVTRAAEVRQQALGSDVEGHLGLGRIVLENHRRRVGRIEDRTDGHAAAEIGHRDRLVVGQVGGPDLGVFSGDLGPADAHTRGGGRSEEVDGEVLRLHPVDVDVVGVGVGAFRMVNQRAIGQGGGAVERLAGIGGVGDQRRLQPVIPGLSRAFTRQQLLAERGIDNDRFHPLAHAHHIRTEEFAGAGANILCAEEFHKHRALSVVGAQARAAVAVVIPQRPQLGWSTGAIAGRAGACRHIFQSHMAGQVAIVNDVGRLDPARRHLDFGPGEGVLRPID